MHPQRVVWVSRSAASAPSAEHDRRRSRRSRGSGPRATAGCSRQPAHQLLGVGLRPLDPQRAGCAARAAPATPRTCPGIAPIRSRRPLSTSYSSSSRVTSAPSSTSLCPARYLVAECTTRSAPSVERLLQQRAWRRCCRPRRTRPPRGRPRRSAARSATSSAGLVGDSSHTSAASSQAATTASVSVDVDQHARAAGRGPPGRRAAAGCRCRRAGARPPSRPGRPGRGRWRPRPARRRTPGSGRPRARRARSSNAVQVGLP